MQYSWQQTYPPSHPAHCQTIPQQWCSDAGGQLCLSVLVLWLSPVLVQPPFLHTPLLPTSPLTRPPTRHPLQSPTHPQTAHWLAHEAGIASLDMIPGRELLLSASRDCNVSVWTLNGGLLGTFGEHGWALEDASTWVDPCGLNTRGPLPIKRPGQEEGREEGQQVGCCIGSRGWGWRGGGERGT